MWDEILDALELHNSAVLTAYDEYEFPFSVRCHPTAGEDGRRLFIDIPDAAGIQPGKASLLMHSHNEELWDLVQFLIRGTLVYSQDGWYFVPARTQGSPRSGSTLDDLRNLREMRQRANAYLKRRGIDRPAVPWDDIQRLQEEAGRLREKSE